jgi:hypothetical protein
MKFSQIFIWILIVSPEMAIMKSRRLIISLKIGSRLCERSEAITQFVTDWKNEIAASIRSSQ